MTTCQVDDIVRVKTDYIDDKGTPSFVSNMDRYRGTFVTITHAYLNDNNKPRCRIAEDVGHWVWRDEFFEPLPDTSKDTYGYW